MTSIMFAVIPIVCWNNLREAELFIPSREMYESEELAEMVQALSEGRFEDYKTSRKRFFPFVSARELLRFLDEYADRRARRERLMADGLDWGAARAVLADLLWDFECGRKPDLAKHVRRRSQTRADIAWGTAASIGAASFLPAMALYAFFKDFSWAVVYMMAATLGPFAVLVCRSALNYQWQPALRVILWSQLIANLVITSIPYALVAVTVLNVFIPLR